MRYTCIDGFSGAGGLSLGLINAGFDVVYAFDSDPISIETHAKNKKYFTHRADVADINELTGAALLKNVNIAKGDLFLLAGGPPCQGFSVQRIGADVDDRNNLVVAYAHLIDEIQPKFFLMENVPGLTGRRGKAILDFFLNHIVTKGYRPFMKVLNAEDYGVPQRRKRVFVVGVRNDLYKGEFTFNHSNGRSNGRITVADVLLGLPEPPQDGKDHPRIVHHRRDKLNERNLSRIRALKPGQGMEHLPIHLLADCHKVGADKIGHRNVYGRMAWDDVAPTITARFDSFTRGKFGHPEQDRSITLREGALLQTFPMDFEFSGNKVEIARQIGNAVPPKLAEAVGKMILRYYETE